ncbi:MAG: nuclear transport factor 2 family protein [Candidatus Heimdallarchaeota archaeon]|nr:MAG: nuclear transport factor 2 family protein [Candidatus Heimdallarchaeota archaeon]
MRDPKLVALLYNEQINTRNLEGIIALMAYNHKFIDSKNRVENKAQMKKSWEEFFTEYPDYKNIFHTVISRNKLVILLGHSECSEPVLDGPAIWTAKIENDQIAEWRIYLDTEENRKKLSID